MHKHKLRYLIYGAYIRDIVLYHLTAFVISNITTCFEAITTQLVLYTDAASRNVSPNPCNKGFSEGKHREELF